MSSVVAGDWARTFADALADVTTSCWVNSRSRPHKPAAHIAVAWLPFPLKRPLSGPLATPLLGDESTDVVYDLNR